MSAFDHERFNGFARNELDDLVFSDLWNLCIFNERDMHAAAYMYIREYFEKHERENIYVRCEPKISGVKPDIVVFDQGNPVYLLEFKMLMEKDKFDKERTTPDLDKMADLIDEFSTIKWGFFMLIYDDDGMFKPGGATLRRRGYDSISVTSINARKKEDSERRRTGYDAWRREFDRLVGSHKRYS